MKPYQQKSLEIMLEDDERPSLLIYNDCIVFVNEPAKAVISTVWLDKNVAFTFPDAIANAIIAGHTPPDYQHNGEVFRFTVSSNGAYKIVHLYPSQCALASLPASHLEVAGAHLSELLQKQLSLLNHMKRNAAGDSHTRVWDEAHRNTLRILRLTRHMTEYAQYINHTKKLNAEEIDIAAWLRQFADRIRKRTGEDSLTFQTQIREHSLLTAVDLEKLEKALLNLLSNAFKFSPPECPVLMTAEAGQGTLRIAVADSGPGLSPDQMAVLWQPVTTARPHSENESAGYGLALVKCIARLHGGDVSAESVPGQGLRVVMSLPLRSENINRLQRPRTFFDDMGGFSVMSVELSDVNRADK